MWLLNKRNPIELPFEVLAQAHWRPQDVELSEKHKKRGDGEFEYLRLQQLWRKKETFVNYAFDSLLFALSADERGEFFGLLIGHQLGKSYLLSGKVNSDSIQAK